MNILFLLLCVEVDDNKSYSNAAHRLIEEILTQTNHDILLNTNSNLLTNKYKSNNRIILQDTISTTTDTLKYNSEFNYNLKYHVFNNVPLNYDILIYLDCDIKLNGWNLESEKFLKQLFIESDYDLGATRLNCVLASEIYQYKETGHALFSHKIQSYKILDNYNINDDIMLSKLPSEHFLLLKNDSNKITKFYQKWQMLNRYLQSINGDGGSWGDGFEIGISARHAGFHKTIEISQGEWDGVLGFKFNGNKE